MKIYDLVGRRFGRLVVIAFAYIKNNKRWWLCKCDCGNTCIVRTSSLLNGATQSCGCLQKERTSIARRDDLVGQTINGIYVESVADKKTNGLIHYNCICYCGNHFVTAGKRLKNGRCKSCGCLVSNKAHRRFQDLTGCVFDDLFVESLAYKDDKGRYWWNCICACGRRCVVLGDRLRQKKTTSCGCKISKNESQISSYLEKHKIQYQTQKSFIGCKNKMKLRFDFFLVDYGVVIEYDGEFHYRNLQGLDNDLEYQKRNDDIKTQYCHENDLVLIRIPYWEKKILSKS